MTSWRRKTCPVAKPKSSSLSSANGPESLQAQIERQIRDAVRAGALRPGAAVPSTRDLAADLGVSRPLVMEAYAQLAAEGYLALRQGAAPRVSEFAATAAPVIPPNSIEVPEEFRYNFKTGTPDLQSFPRAQWVRAASKAIRSHGARGIRLWIPDRRDSAPRGARRLSRTGARRQRRPAAGPLRRRVRSGADALCGSALESGHPADRCRGPRLHRPQRDPQIRLRDDPRPRRRRRDHASPNWKRPRPRPCCSPLRISIRPAG